MPLSSQLPQWGAAVHQLIVFASVDCETVTVEAKFSNSDPVLLADVRIFDGKKRTAHHIAIGDDGTKAGPHDTIDHSEGLVNEVDTGSHGNHLDRPIRRHRTDLSGRNGMRIAQ